MRTIEKPVVGEYPEYSAVYLDLLDDDGTILEHLWQNYLKIREFVYSLPAEKLSYRYAEGKWTIKEIFVHIIDDERIFSYRTLRYARNDGTPLPGFDQDEYTGYSHANERSLDSIFEEYEAVRRSTIALFEHLPEDCLMRSGTVIEANGTVADKRTVRGMVYHIAGHELRHLNIIKERYL